MPIFNVFLVDIPFLNVILVLKDPGHDPVPSFLLSWLYLYSCFGSTFPLLCAVATALALISY
jgi:hypothetical protein